MSGQPLDIGDTQRARIGTVRTRTSRISQVVTLVAVIVPPLGILSAMGLLWGVAFHWVDLVLLVGLYVVCAFGTTIGFTATSPTRLPDEQARRGGAAILGCMTMQGPLTQWVTDHRKHHALSDQPGDPHSPHVGHGEGAWGPSAVSSTRTWAGCSRTWGWSRGASTARTLRQPARPHDRPALPALGRAHARVPFLIGYAVGGTLRGRLRRARLGRPDPDLPLPARDVQRQLDLPHVRPAGLSPRDEARNNRLVAVLVFGEGWHNNHHAFPSSARHGSCAASSTSPGGSSAASSASASSGT